MENRIELLVAELLAPIERRQIFGDKIASVSAKILEVARAKIIDHGQARVRKFLLQGERQIGADEASSARDDEIEKRIG